MNTLFKNILSFFSVVLFSIFITACTGGGASGGASGGSGSSGGSSTAQITSFTFTNLDPSTVITTINEALKEISIAVPFNTDLTNLTPKVTFVGVDIKVDGISQKLQLQIKPHDFSKPVKYTVIAEDGTTQSYSVVVTAAKSSDARIFSYSISGVAGTFDGNNISVVLPSSTTSLSNLTATFTASTNNVKIGNVTQHSGLTKNDFTNPLNYIVIAADGITTQIYSVKVSIAKSSDARILSYSISGVAGTFDGNNISVVLPSSTTSLSNLTATFTASTNNVKIGNVTQYSGLTKNDFTNPLDYIVTAADGITTQIYSVKVSIAKSSDARILSYSISGVAGTFDGNNISVVLPSSTTSLSNLTATFTASTNNVKIGNIIQYSGLTKNDFTNPLNYIVTAADGITTKVYRVNVTIDSSGSSYVNGWPKYVAMGTVTLNQCTVANQCNDEEPHPVDAVFKYAGYSGHGDRGYIPYPGAVLGSMYFVHQMALKPWINNRPVRPVMVEYTANYSNDGETLGTDDFELNNMSKHFINLSLDTNIMYQAAESDVYGSIVLNPDALGYIEQNNYVGQINARLSAQKDAVNVAVARVICFMGLKESWNNQTFYPYGATITTTPTQIALIANGRWTPDPNAQQTWPANAWYSQCNNINSKNPTPTLPNFSDDFVGWIQANNWLIQEYGHHKITFGWQDNLWANGSDWVRNTNAYAPDASQKIASSAANPMINFLNSQQVYTGAYKPDFIVIDRYEMDDTNAVNAGWFFNDSAWSNLLTFTKLISAGLVPDRITPIMLWQIPGGHIQSTSVNESDKRDSNGATFTDYLFGDSNLNAKLSNIQPYWSELPILPSQYYTSCSNCTPIKYLQQNNYDWSKDNGNMRRLADSSHVFAILWGGGNTTGVNVIGSRPGFPGSDGGWLASKIEDYYKNPQMLNWGNAHISN